MDKQQNNKMIAYCGLICSSCPINLATIETDSSKKEIMRQEIAKQCSEYFNRKYRADEINDCLGCKNDEGILFEECLRCEVRRCAHSKNIENCAYCEQYPCEQLEKIFDTDPEIKNRLDKIKNNINQ